MIYFASPTEDSGASEVAREMKGGAIYVEDKSTINIEGGIIHNHESLYGGAIYIASGGTVNMTAGTIEYNYSKYGGAIYVESGATLNLQGGKIINNKAENAPAIYAESGSTVTIGANADIDVNEYITFNDTIINFYVDGELSEIVYQCVPTLNLGNAPLDYEECNGYFLDEKMVNPVEQGVDLTQIEIKNNSVQTISANTSADDNYLIYNLYTRTATPDKINFTLVNNTHYSVSDNNARNSLVIPKEYNNLPVLEVDEEGFNNRFFNEVYFPSNFKSIADNAFKGCDNLTTINIPEGLEIIGTNSFQFCRKLQNFYFPSTLVEINNEAFNYCENLQEVTIPESVVYLGELSFAHMFSLSCINYNAIQTNNFNGESGVFDNSGTSSESGATAIIGNKVKHIPNFLFKTGGSFTSSAISIKSIIFAENSVCESIGAYAFGNLDITEINLPNSLKSIGIYALMDTQITSITIPENVTSIGNNAFVWNDYLTEINFNATYLDSSDRPFSSCGDRGDGIILNIGSNVKYIPCLFDRYASNYPYSKVTFIKFSEDSVCESIGEYAFSNLTNLTEIVLSDNISNVGNYAFSNCTSLTSIHISANTILGGYVFAGANENLQIYFSGESLELWDENWNYYSANATEPFFVDYNEETGEGHIHYIG